MASFPLGTSSSGLVPIQCNEGNDKVLLPVANSPAQGDVCEGETIRIRPTILIENGGLMFINGARTLAENIPTWLGHDATDDICVDGNETVEEARTWTELVFESDSTVAITVPYRTSTCCKEVFISHSALDKHLSVAHSDAFRRYVCALCMRSQARYRQIAVHYSFCRKTNKGEEVVSIADSKEGAEATQTENSNPFISLTTESGSEDTEEGDLSQRTIPVIIPAFQCEECDRSFPTKTGLSQHERFKHANLRNAKRIADHQLDIERKRNARLESTLLAEKTGTKHKPKKALWTEDEIELLVRLEEELSGVKFINKAIAERMPTKTNKQIGTKRKTMRDASKAKTTTAQNSTPALQPVHDTMPTQPHIPLEDMFHKAICISELECVEMSAELLNHAIEGKDLSDLQNKLIATIKSACSKPIKAKPNGPANSNKNPPGNKKNKQEEYRRVQNLYSRRRKQLAAEILDGKKGPTKCDVDPQVVQETYQARFGGESQEVNLSKYPKAKPADNEMLIRPISQQEIQKAYSRAKKDSASGPDGIGLKKLKELDPQFAMTTNLYNVWLFTGKVPIEIKENRSILLPKGATGLDDVNNWRPLTISSVLLRLYTNILAKRVTKGVPLNPRQRGFIEAPGCSENGFMLQRIQKHAKQNRKRLSVVFLDLAKAFDTVSHKHIQEGLKRFCINEHFIETVVDLYTDASTHFTLAKGDTSKIPMTRGVKQGDPLSPLLFNIAMDPLLEAISAQKNGYKWDESGLQLEALCYADDNGLLTEDPKQMQLNLEVVNEFCQATGMKLNVKKSAGYDIKPCANRSYVINDFRPKWEVDGQELPLIAPADSIKYLGVKVNSWTGVTQEELGEKLELWCSRIDKAPLKPRQKMVMLNQYAIGRLQFYLSQVETPQCKLEEMDLTIRRYAKRWLKLPECATDHILYAGTEKGGLSLPISPM